MSERNSPGVPSGLDQTGSLTIGARQAVRDYMLRIFAVGGTIGAIVAGVAGYMINDLAKETALTTALTEMQKPILEGVQKLSEANSKLANANVEVEALRKRVENLDKVVQEDGFVQSVVERLAKNEKLGKRIQEKLVIQVAKQLLTNHRNDLRGVPGKDAVSPSVSEVADVLVSEHRDKLRGPPGKDGGSPSASEVAAVLMNEQRVKLIEYLNKPAPAPVE